MKIGVIGTGTIAGAIVTGLNRARYPYDQIILSKRSAAVSTRLARDCARVRVSDDNQQIVDQADMLLLAVRPQVAKEVLSGLRFRPGRTIVSLVATLSLDTLRDWTGSEVTLVRAMPLPFVATCEGATPIFPGDDAVVALFDRLGQSIVTGSEEEFDTLGMASATMGLYFGVQEVLVDWLVAEGINSENARAYVGAIYLNLAKTGLAESEQSLADLRQGHSTRGGLNEQLHRVFVEAGGANAIRAGLNSVLARVCRATPSEN